MKKSDVKVGSIYIAKISDGVVPVSLDQANAVGGWDATNLATKRHVRIKSAAKLRRVATEKDIAEAREALKAAKAERAASRAKKSAKAPSKATETKAATRAKRGGQKKIAATPGTVTKKAAPKKERKPSGLDLAAKVLSASKEPLDAKTITERAIAAGWKTSGQTPHATLYAAIIREIASKGKEARFEKVDRGLFKSRKGA